jgi:RNA polymerase sigma factor (sigma-70 family)
MAGSGIRKYLRAAGLDPANGATDAELIAQFAENRDEAAFELLVFRHAGLVQRACRAVLHDHHAAEDAAQATFLALARKAGTITGRGTVVGWLYRVARRVAVRASKRRVPVAVAELYDAPARAPAELEADLAAAICAEVDRLPERYRVPVLLCFFEGLTHTEAARRAGVPVGTIAGRLARAKDLLAKRLSRRGLALASVALPVVSGTFAGSTARAACEFAAGRSVEFLVSQSVLSLARGALKPMIPNFVKVVGAVAFACATVGGVLAFVPDAPPPVPPAPPLVEAPEVPVAANAADPKLPDADAAQRRYSMNNLKQILIALHNYESALGHMPNDITDKNGKPLLSWRVAILPYIEQDQLYGQFKLNEPWDSEHNKKLLEKMPRTYRTFDADRKATKTHFQVFSGPGTAFVPGKKVRFGQVTDGLSNTLGVIEAGPAVEWTKPADINYDAKKAFPRPTGPFANTFHVAMLDGAAHALKPDLKDDVFRKLVEIADGNVIAADELKASFPAATKEERAIADKMQAENLALAKKIAEALEERQKLIEALLKKKPAAGPNLDELADQHEGLKRELDKIQRDIEELKARAREK